MIQAEPIEGADCCKCQCQWCAYNEECCGICEGEVNGCEPPIDEHGMYYDQNLLIGKVEQSQENEQ